ncbi:MAG: DUF6477 family protein [Pseudomonadota bacterium]
MSRPTLLVRAAKTGARMYRRERDLPGAVPGLLQKPENSILPQLIATEQRCEAARRAKSPAYLIGHHVQVLAALLAERSQVKASGSDILRSAT